ncbi:Lactation elevated protein 1 [Hordeum vulgare]|nr:Lactation elevated protein 1 [Hordeum vulgare]
MDDDKPDENKNTKDKIKREVDASSMWDKIDAMMQSNELMVAKTLEAKKELAEKEAQENQEKWQLLKEEGLRKAVIEERRALVEENKALAKLLQKEKKITMMNRNDMNDITKKLHDIARRKILKRWKQAATGRGFGAGDGE